MPLDIQLERADGTVLDRVTDWDAVIEGYLPHKKDTSFVYMHHADRWAGGLSITRKHIQPFLAEWRRVVQMARSDADREFLSRVEQLVVRCAREKGLRIGFYPD